METFNTTNMDEYDKTIDHEYLMQQFTANSETQLDILSIMASIMGVMDDNTIKNKMLQFAFSITYDYLIELLDKYMKEKDIISNLLLNIKNKYDDTDDLEIWSDFDDDDINNL